MAHELVCKNTQRGLDPGSRGFCTVGRSASFPSGLQAALEGFSSLATGNRPGSLHLSCEQNDQTIHVVGHLLAAESDSARRQVELAHYIVPEAGELPDAGPAWLASSRLFSAQWNGEPREIGEPVSIPAGTVAARTATLWKQLTGSSDTAKRLASAARSGEVVWVVYSSHVPILQLFLEASQLLPSEDRWKATFSTDFDTQQFKAFESGGAGSVRCLWRGVPEGSREIAELRTLDGARIVNLVKQVREYEGAGLKLGPPEEMSSSASPDSPPLPVRPQGKSQGGTRRSAPVQRPVGDSSAETDGKPVHASGAARGEEASDESTFRLRPVLPVSNVAPAEPAEPAIDEADVVSVQRGIRGGEAQLPRRRGVRTESVVESPMSHDPETRRKGDADSRRPVESEPPSPRRRGLESEASIPISDQSDSMPSHRGSSTPGKPERGARVSQPRRAGRGVENSEEFETEDTSSELAEIEMPAGNSTDSGMPPTRSGMQVDVDYRRLAIFVAVVLLIGVAVTVVPGLLGDNREAITLVTPQNASSTLNVETEAAADAQSEAVEKAAEDFSHRIRRVNEIAVTIRGWDGVETPEQDLRSINREMLRLTTELKRSPPGEDVRSTLELAKDSNEWLEHVFAAKQALDPALILAGSSPGTVISNAQIQQAIEQVEAIEIRELPKALQQHISRTRTLLSSVEGIDRNSGSIVRTVELPSDSTFAIVDASVPRRSLIDTFELTLTRRAADEPQQIEEVDRGEEVETLRRFQLKRGERQIAELAFRTEDTSANDNIDSGSALRLELQISHQTRTGDFNRLELTLRGPLFRRVYRLQSQE
jgi:hypothetical protein